MHPRFDHTMSWEGRRFRFADAHIDSLQKVASSVEAFLSGNLADAHVDLPRMRLANLGLAGAAIWVDIADQRGPEKTAKMLEAAKSLVAHSDSFAIPCRASEIRSAIQSGRIVLCLTIEGAYQLDWISMGLPKLRQYGVRTVTLMHSTANRFGDSSTDSSLHNGLSCAGQSLIKSLAANGIGIDVSHSSTQTLLQTAACAGSPIIASHSCCQALHPHPRNLSDREILAVAATGGIVCICAHEPYLGDGTSDLNTIVRHVRHVANLAGIECVGIGTDFDGGIRPPADFNSLADVPKLCLALADAGFTDREVDAILFSNLVGYYERLESALPCPL